MQNNSRRSENLLLNLAEYQQQSTVLESLPLAVIVELTQNCNLHCDYCRPLIHNQLNLNMRREVFDRVAQTLFPTACLVDLRGWGESTLRKDFSKFIETTSAYGPQIRLITNALVPRPDVWDQLMAERAILGVSCDTADPHLFAQLRSGADLNRLRDHVRKIVRYRDIHHAPEDSVFFTAVVTSLNARHLSGLINMANDLMVRKVVLFPISIEPGHPLHLRNDLESVRRGLEEALETANRYKIDLRLAAALDDSLRLKKRTHQTCIHPWSYVVIDYHGQISFCDLLIGNPKYSLGLFDGDNFQSIWNSETFQHLRKAHINRSLPNKFSACRWCYLMRYIDFEDLIHPNLDSQVVSNANRSMLFDISEPLSPIPEFY